MTLQARDTFRDGGLWTLRQWYLVVRGRSATDPRDLIFAGLSLIKPDLLRIDPALLCANPVPEPAVYKVQFALRRYYPRLIPSQNSKNAQRTFQGKKTTKDVTQMPLIPSGLWPKLRVDYTADMAEVFLQAAACLLTHTGTKEILSLAARTNRREAYYLRWLFCPEDEIAVEDIPSWIPVPGSFTVSRCYCISPQMSC